MNTMPSLGTPNPELALALKQLSAAKYGHPKSEVEKEIFDRLATIEPPKSLNDPMARMYNQSNSPISANSATSRPAISAPPKSSSSFLDDWLQKKKSPSTAANFGPPRQNTPPPKVYDTKPQPNPFSSSANNLNPLPSDANITANNDRLNQSATLTSQVNPLTNTPAITDVPDEPSKLDVPNENESNDGSEFGGEFKIPQNTPKPAQVDDTIFIDTAGNLHDGNDT
jgi:hypothetical protein